MYAELFLFAVDTRMEEGRVVPFKPCLLPPKIHFNGLPLFQVRLSLVQRRVQAWVFRAIKSDLGDLYRLFRFSNRNKDAAQCRETPPR